LLYLVAQIRTNRQIDRGLAMRAPDAAPQIHLGLVWRLEIVPDVRSAIRVGRRIFNRICHRLRLKRSPVPGRVPTLSIRGQRSLCVDRMRRQDLLLS
jgi:hypothetical protein